MEEDVEVPFILEGHLWKQLVIIDVDNGKLKVGVQDKQVNSMFLKH